MLRRLILPAEPKTLDAMTNEEFDVMMQTGLEQAKRGESVPCEEAFEQHFIGLNMALYISIGRW